MKNFLLILAGAVAGGGVCFVIADRRAKKRADAEIESVKKEFFSRVEECLQKDIPEEKKEEPKPEAKPDAAQLYEKPSIIDYAAKISQEKYATKKDSVDIVMEETKKGHHVISKLNYGEFEEQGFKNETLYYFLDNVVTDSMYMVIDDADDIIGLESLTHIGDPDQDVDAVHVRNDYLKTDYEIIAKDQTFEDFIHGAKN